MIAFNSTDFIILEVHYAAAVTINRAFPLPFLASFTLLLPFSLRFFSDKASSYLQTCIFPDSNNLNPAFIMRGVVKEYIKKMKKVFFFSNLYIFISLIR